MENIRNFCIIAHIDHGKSTLADRLLEYTHTINITEGQMLDDMDLEKERGITIKSHAIQMEYEYQGQKYILNLIDTPGHVDFSYEVSRSIAACEGAILVVDATQGVQAQTISNLYMAIDHDLEIIPVINKCDMQSAMPDEVEDEIIELLGCKREEIIRASARTGMGVEEILNAIVERVPHPEGDPDAPLQALIFDSVFNSFRGIIAYFKIEELYLVTLADGAVLNLEICYDSAERVEYRVKNESLKRSIRITYRAWNTLHYGIQYLLNAHSCTGRCTYYLITLATQQFNDLILNLIRHGALHIALVDHRDYLQVMVNGHIKVADGLRLDALSGVYNQDGALAGCYGT